MKPSSHFRIVVSASAVAVTLVAFTNCTKGFDTAVVSSVNSSASTAPPPATTNPDPTPVTSDPSVGIVATKATDFLSSLGICIHHAQGPTVDSYVTPLKYIGVANVRDDYANPADFIDLHNKTGVRVNLLAKSGDVATTVTSAAKMADAGALLSIEGPNEPNNWPITYQGKQGGGSGTWLPLANFQKDLYAAVKANPKLASTPVFSITEAGAETDNVGLQFTVIPEGASTVLPAGTKFADYAAVHNYVSSNRNSLVDNQAWNAADPTLNDAWDGFYVEYGRTWGHGYAGYTNDQLPSVPRVTTETGWDSKGNFGGEAKQGTVLLNNYLSQFKRGWRYTFIYMLRDGEGGDGNQGIYNADSTPKLAAKYIHNLTTILADTGAGTSVGRLDYGIANAPSTVHDLLLQKSDGTFELVVWDERASGNDAVNVSFGTAVASLKVYDPTVGTTATSSQTKVSELSLTLSDHPVVLEIKK